MASPEVGSQNPRIWARARKVRTVRLVVKKFDAGIASPEVGSQNPRIRARARKVRKVRLVVKSLMLEWPQKKKGAVRSEQQYTQQNIQCTAYSAHRTAQSTHSTIHNLKYANISAC